ncbi:MAG: hypothetical protein M3P22_01630 [bacterium]|nr:hypothetical protein [bacterium]
MIKNNKNNPSDKRKAIQQSAPLTRAPRLKGVVHKKGIKPIKKEKKS